MRGVVCDRLGLALGDDAVLCEVAWRLPSRGLVALEGPDARGRGWLSRLLARHELPPDARVCGQARREGLDWRIYPAAALVTGAATSGLGVDAVRDALIRRVPAVKLLALTEAEASQGKRQALHFWAAEVLMGLGLLDTLPLAARVDALDEVQRWLLAIVMEVAREPQTLIVHVDGALPDAVAAPLCALLSALARQSLVILSCARAPASVRFDARAWMRQGCLLDAPDAPVPTPRPLPAAPPLWLRWVIHPRLAGMPRPGAEVPLEDAVAALHAQQITHILTLEEQPHHHDVLRASGFTAWHLAIPDMHAPRLEEARLWAQRVLDAIDAGGAVAIHCKAGIGRTGTLLAMCLMLQGYSYAQALLLLRSVYPHFIQSEAQHAFLRAFDDPTRAPAPRTARDPQ